MKRGIELMKRWALVGLLSVVFLGVAGDLLACPIRVATLNVKNYNADKSEGEKQSLVEAIREVEPDVLLLQEIGELSDLEDLQALVGQGEYSYKAYFQRKEGARHNLAVLSRYPWFRVELCDVENGSGYVNRGLLKVTFLTCDPDTGQRKLLNLITLHLKSNSQQSDQRDCSVRKNEAHMIAAAARKMWLDPLLKCESCYMIAGDFNDGTESSVLKAFEEGTENEMNLFRLPACDYQGCEWTYRDEGENHYSTLDHMLISPTMLDHVNDAKAYISATPNMNAASDHRMVWCEVNLAILYPLEQYGEAGRDNPCHGLNFWTVTENGYTAGYIAPEIGEEDVILEGKLWETKRGSRIWSTPVTSYEIYRTQSGEVFGFKKRKGRGARTRDGGKDEAVYSRVGSDSEPYDSDSGSGSPVYRDVGSGRSLSPFDAIFFNADGTLTDYAKSALGKSYR